MEKNRIQKLEQILKDFFAAYGCLTNSPDETVQRMKLNHTSPQNRKEMLICKALQIIAELDPSIDALSITETEMLAELYDSTETVRHQAETLAKNKGVTLRTVYRMRLDLLEKIDKTLSIVLSDSDRQRCFETRWRS